MRTAHGLVLAVCSVFSTLLPACGGSSGGGSDDGGTTAEQLAALKASDVGIYFGHQSVGGNIVSGVGALLQEVAVADRLQLSGDLGSAGPGVWVDNAVGSNQQPLTKIAAFQANVTAHCAQLDVAFLKFCYVDSDWFSGHTPAELLVAYQDMVTAIHTSCPGVQLVHFTMPLQTSGNSTREQYNALLRNAYGSAVFDIAHWESDAGSCASGGVPVLCSRYTSDGGHLNEAGSRYVAAKLIAHLAGL